MKRIIQSALGSLGYELVKKSRFQTVKQLTSDANDLRFFKTINAEARSRCLDLLDYSKSQLRQDLFVLSELGFAEHGYFVEFGATDGIDRSNSHLLEKVFRWDGILAEPARMWHQRLTQNRAASIETKCVWSMSGGTLIFNETEAGEFSTIDSFSGSDRHSSRRSSGRRYEVETISLLDLLSHYNAPECIDYLSIDTEGSEYEILSAFDFDQYQFRVITCEHNNTSAREKIHDLLTSKGYIRKFEEISQFDDWYVKAD